MTTIEDLLGVCAEWSTVDEMQSRLGLPQSSRAHRALKNVAKFWEAQGALESRKAPDGPRQFRAGGWQGRKIRPVQPRIMEALADGPKTVREVAETAGIGGENARKALRRMQYSGAAEVRIIDRTGYWTLKEAHADGL